MHSERKVAYAEKRPRFDRYVSRPSMRRQRGFACIALDRPTDPVNVGHALRAEFCFDARMVIIGGTASGIKLPKLQTDPMRSYKHIPVIRSTSLVDAVPEGATLVAVELCDDASMLMEFKHPERACYVFGPENGTISDDILKRCAYKVMIPTISSLNLGMTVNIVMYDRLAKAWDKLKERQDRIDQTSAKILAGFNS